jgi:hypothetical protein
VPTKTKTKPAVRSAEPKPASRSEGQVDDRVRGWGDRLGNMLVECMVLIARRPGGTIGISIYDPRLTSSPPTTDTSTESDLRAILTDLGYKETEITEILGTLRKGNSFGPKRRMIDKAMLVKRGFSV